MTTFGDQVFEMGGKPVGAPVTQGRAIYVKPYSGGDGNDGKTIQTAVKTLTQALALATAHQNDTVYLIAENDSASGTTDYQTATDVGLVWNKDMVHIIGVGPDGVIGQRSRVGWVSTINNTTATPLFTLSASGCKIENVAFFAGVNDAQSVGAVLVTGNYNHFKNCQISGIGHDTMDVANAYSLGLDGAKENTFDGCYIGLDTVARGTSANCEILLKNTSGASTTGCTRNIFRNCLIVTYAEATGHQFIMKTATGVDRFVMFDNCQFINGIGSAASLMSEAIDWTASTIPGGICILNNCYLYGATDWEAATVSGEVYGGGAGAVGNVVGLSNTVAAS